MFKQRMFLGLTECPWFQHLQYIIYDIMTYDNGTSFFSALMYFQAESVYA